DRGPFVQREMLAISGKCARPPQEQCETTARGQIHVRAPVILRAWSRERDAGELKFLVLVEPPRRLEPLTRRLREPLLREAVQVVDLDRERTPQEIQQNASNPFTLGRRSAGQRRMRLLPDVRCSRQLVQGQILDAQEIRLLEVR